MIHKVKLTVSTIIKQAKVCIFYITVSHLQDEIKPHINFGLALEIPQPFNKNTHGITHYTADGFHVMALE